MTVFYTYLNTTPKNGPNLQWLDRNVGPLALGRLQWVCAVNSLEKPGGIQLPSLRKKDIGWKRVEANISRGRTGSSSGDIAVLLVIESSK